VKKPVSAGLTALDINRVSAVSYAIYVRDGEFHDYVRVVYPEPRSGLLATVLTGTGELDRNLFRLIPPDVSGYAVGAVSIPAIVEQTLKLAKGLSPMLKANVDKFIFDLRRSTGVDPEEDLLSPMGDQFLSLQWPASEKVAQGMAVLINLHDPLRFQNALEVLQPKIPVRIKWDLIDNRRVYRFRVPGAPENEWPVLTVVGDFLLIAGGERAFQAIQAQLNRPRMNHDARSYLAELPEGTFIASWVDLASSLRAQLVGLQELADMTGNNETFQSLLSAIEDLAGTTRTTALRDERGAVYRSHSPVGNLQALAILSIGASIAIPNLVAARSAYRDLEAVTNVEWDANVTRLMQTIAKAQEEFRDSGFSDVDGNGVGEYGTLKALKAKGLLTPVDLGADVGNGVFRRHGYLISLFLPDSIIAQETHFVAVAWPDKGRTGQVYGSTPERPAMVNDIIARETGIQQIDPRDIFVSGSLTAGLVAGWRDLESTSTIKPRFLGGGNQTQIEGELRLMQQAEEQGDRKLLIVLLKAQDPAVAARAAHDLGNLRAREAVPDLCSALSSQSDLGVRLQIMGALNKIGDPRSYHAAVESLNSESVLLRALAAANLGKAGNPDGVQPLLTLLGSAETDSEDKRDRVQAIMSLNELARTDCLLPAAAATSDDNPEVGRALAYLFQSLSPKLAAEEASSLMSVLNHQSQLLRRYAIQRLGELKDSTTVRALEGRLAVEDESLRPLILVALDSIRARQEATPGSDFSDSVSGHATEFFDGVRRRWSRMSGPQRLVAKLGVGMLLIVAGLFLAARARRKRKQYGEEWVAMVAPSSDFATPHNDHAQEDYQEVVPEDYAEEEHLDHPEESHLDYPEESQVDFEEVADEVIPEPVDEESQQKEEIDFTVWDYQPSEEADDEEEEEESVVGSEDYPES
jgi:HEAT repeat protein